MFETLPETVRGHSGTLAQVSGSSPEGIMRGMAIIYVALEDEGVDVWRPVEATPEGESVYRIAETATPETEAWEFPPGSRVRCEQRELSDGPALVAVAPA
jgi:hypothetical protein